MMSKHAEIIGQPEGTHMRPEFNFLTTNALVAQLLIAASAVAQPKIITDPDTAALLISGETQRVWIAQAVVAPLGGTSCEEGLRYRFHSDGAAQSERCIDGTWDTTTMSWSISGGGISILKVVLGQTTYEATLVEHPDNLELVLESNATDKDTKTTRVAMTYALD